MTERARSGRKKDTDPGRDARKVAAVYFQGPGLRHTRVCTRPQCAAAHGSPLPRPRGQSARGSWTSNQSRRAQRSNQSGPRGEQPSAGGAGRGGEARLGAAQRCSACRVLSCLGFQALASFALGPFSLITHPAREKPVSPRLGDLSRGEVAVISVGPGKIPSPSWAPKVVFS